MPTSSRRASRLLLNEHEPQIALAALTRLRWIAVFGQITAMLVAVKTLGLHLPLPPMALVVGVTALSNAGLVWGMRLGTPPPYVVPFVLLLDIAGLTTLLFFTGGATNPFSSLYLVHIAMAVTVLGAGWTWLAVAMVALCYAALFMWNVPLKGEISPSVHAAGSWLALVLVSVLIAVFISRVERALRNRENELASVSERATRSERLAALTTLAAGAAHELNTPLGTIALAAKELEMAADPFAAADSVREDARLIRQEVERCRIIINRLRLDIEDSASEHSPIAIQTLFARVRDDLRPHEASRLQVSIDPNLPPITTSARALEQALLVLLRNAFDASTPHGTVELAASKSDSHVRFTIRDQGVGMSPEMLRRAGEPFFTTKEPGKGMGLGLFLVRLIAERCNAEFSIDSTPGQGTTCTLDLPAPQANNT